MSATASRKNLNIAAFPAANSMGFCASMAAVLGLPDYAGPAIAAAVETEAKPILIWLEFQDCAATRNLFCAPAIRRSPISFWIRFLSTTMKL